MMKTIRVSFNLPSLAIALALVGVIGYQAAARRTAQIGPTVVVTVDRTKVLENLKERAAAEAGLAAMKDDFKAEADRRKGELDGLRDQYQSATSDADKTKLRREIEKKTYDLQGYLNFVNNRGDIELSLLYQSLYNSISSAVKQMAEAEHYDIVLVYDRDQSFLPPDPKLRVSREDQIKQQIAARRIMYASEAVDITDALIVRMNNAYDTQ